MRFTVLSTSALLAATVLAAPTTPAEWQDQQAAIQQQNIDQQNAVNAAQIAANNGGTPVATATTAAAAAPAATTASSASGSTGSSSGSQGKSGTIGASKYNDDSAQCASLLINSGACAGLGTAGAANPVALGASVFDALGKSAVCGATIKLTNPNTGKTTTATVTDRAGADIVDMCNTNWSDLGGNVADDTNFNIEYSI